MFGISLISNDYLNKLLVENKENKVTKEELERLTTDHRTQTHEAELQAKEIASTHAMQIRKLEAEKHFFVDEQLEKTRKERDEAVTNFKVIEAENKKYKEMIDFEADVLSIKDTVASIIDKLPEVRLGNGDFQAKGKDTGKKENNGG